MTIGKVLKFGVWLMRKEPKIVIANTLNWIPSALMMILLAQAVIDLTGLADSISSAEAAGTVADMSIIYDLFAIIAKYIVVAIPLIIARWVVDAFLRCTYVDITRQAYSRRSIALGGAFSAAKSRFLSLLWTNVVQAVLILIMIVGVVIASLIPSFLFGSLAIFVLPIGGIVLFVLIVLAVAFMYEVPAVVVLENRSGLDAVRRSYEITRANVWRTFAVILVMSIVIGVVNNALQRVPYVDSVLLMFAGLFLGTWKDMMPAVFYYEYAGSPARRSVRASKARTRTRVR
jgi:hypothetical protein